jgi:hypothetical protein
MDERKLIIGLITSTEFIQGIIHSFNIQLIESLTAKRLAMWCLEFYNKYHVAPGKAIEDIFQEKLKKGLPKELALEIEQEILPGLNEEYLAEDFSTEHKIVQCISFLDEKHHRLHSEEVLGLIKAGRLEDAKKLQAEFKPLPGKVKTGIDMSSPEILGRIEKAFSNTSECLIWYPGALGKFMNSQLVRGGFVAFLAHEKMGKTWRLIEMGLRGASQKRKVAYFSAGDMNEDQLIKRICINRAKKSDKEEYSGKMFEPVRDCALNQNDTCERAERECDFGIFTGKPADLLRKETNLPDLIEAWKTNRDYVECHNCSKYAKNNALGVPWIRKIDVGDPLDVREAQKYVKHFFIKYNRNFKISCHPSGTLSVAKALDIMDIWEKEEGFKPDIVIFDYPDIMTDATEKDFRNKQNKIWMDMRGVSDIKDCLTLAVSQADAESYTKDTLQLQNFSEDKRKYAHPTAWYGLNQDHQSREKELGILRINELILREGDFSVKNQVTVLQNLRRGLPFLTSYW